MYDIDLCQSIDFNVTVIISKDCTLRIWKWSIRGLREVSFYSGDFGVIGFRSRRVMMESPVMSL